LHPDVDPDPDPDPSFQIKAQTFEKVLWYSDMYSDRYFIPFGLSSKNDAGPDPYVNKLGKMIYNVQAGT
jgi:hypothetical protein